MLMQCNLDFPCSPLHPSRSFFFLEIHLCTLLKSSLNTALHMNWNKTAVSAFDGDCVSLFSTSYFIFNLGAIVNLRIA